MGNISNRDTRRISFDNNFALSSAITVQKAIENENVIVFDNLTNETSTEILYKDNSFLDVPEDTEVDYWSHRIENLKREHQLINKIIETEYAKQIESTNKISEPPKITHEKVQKIKPCYEWRAKIVQCYEDNPHQPLMCSQVVKAFSQCVASCRVEE